MNMPTAFNWVALGLAIITSTSLLLSRDWRWSLGFLAALYLGVFWLVQAHWTISMAGAKLVTGWMACTILGMVQRNSNPKGKALASPHQGRFFQILTAGMVLAVSFSFSGGLTSWLGISLPIAWASLALMGLGLFHLGITSDPFRIILSLLSIMAGFEIIYSVVEISILVTALLAVVNLGLALAGAYFITSAAEEA